jgi:hypothetical protein
VVREILDELPVAMMVGVVLVVTVSQFNRVVGAVLSVVFWTTVAVVGSMGYDLGHSLGLPGLPFSRPVFLAVCVGFASVHAFAAVSTVRSRRRAEERRRLLADEDP